MNPFDIIVCSILGLSIILSLFKGFVKEFFSLLSYLGGFLMASKYQGTFSQNLMESIPSKPIAKVITFVTIYICTAIIISLVGKLIRGMLYSGKQLSIVDRIMGGFVGLGRGIVIVVALTFPLQYFPKVGISLTKGSQTAPYIAEAFKYIDINQGALNFKNKLTDSFDLDGAKQKIKELKNLKNMSSQIEALKKKIPILSKDSKTSEKSLENYSKEDLQKLNDILKSVDK